MVNVLAVFDLVKEMIMRSNAGGNIGDSMGDSVGGSIKYSTQLF